MPSLTVGLFSEDAAQEEFLTAVLRRLATEGGARVVVHPVSSRGGHGRALDEFKTYHRALTSGIGPAAQLIVVAIDGNCTQWNTVRGEILQSVAPPHPAPIVPACPDPHIERWYMADPVSFSQVVGAQPRLERTKCERGRYKALLQEAIRNGGHTPTLGGIEFARELVEAMDLYRAGQNEASLRSFLRDCRGNLNELIGDHVRPRI